MVKYNIPGQKSLTIENLVIDYNGTLAYHGKPLGNIKNKLNKLAQNLNIYIATADTFGTVESEFKGVNAEITIINKSKGTQEKENLIKDLNQKKTMAIGNGMNDIGMIEKAVLGILILGPEGCATKTLLKSDILVRSINEGLDLLLNPTALKATLRK